MWSTSSVVMRGSCRYSLIRLVYSSSIFCGWLAAAGLAAGLPFLFCARTADDERASAKSAHTKRRCISHTNTAPPCPMSTIGYWTHELLAQGGDRFRPRPRDAAPRGGAARVDRA